MSNLFTRFYLFLAEHFKFLEPQNQEIDELYLGQKSRSTDD